MRNAETATGWRDGATAVAPLLVGVVPFGLAFGVIAGQSVLGPLLGGITSIVIFGGAAQFATVQLFDSGAAPLVVLATALVIQSRHVMYSAALADHFREFPTGWRWFLPYGLTDQAFAVSIVRYETAVDSSYKRRFFAGAAVGLWVTWQITTIVGIVAGAAIPESWGLDFAVPLVFLVLLVPVVTDRPGVVAAVVGGGVAAATVTVPYHLGLLIGAVSGMVAGVAAERWQR
ncbi:MAG TPA: AzlC family ABC transporter permease [Acidimicrobiia bacterium]|jgi:4-azaleucine resistance transporter AzlC